LSRRHVKEEGERPDCGGGWIEPPRPRPPQRVVSTANTLHPPPVGPGPTPPRPPAPVARLSRQQGRVLGSETMYRCTPRQEYRAFASPEPGPGVPPAAGIISPARTRDPRAARQAVGETNGPISPRSAADGRIGSRFRERRRGPCGWPRVRSGDPGTAGRQVCGLYREAGKTKGSRGWRYRRRKARR